MPEHIKTIHRAYLDFTSQPGFTYIADDGEILEKEGSLNIPLYIQNNDAVMVTDPSEAFESWNKSSLSLQASMECLFEEVK